MDTKFKEFVRNPWFITIILVVIAINVVGGLIGRCSRAKYSRQIVYNIGSDNRWQKLLLVLSQIEQNYVDTINYKEISEKTLPLLLQSLDPHSVYLPPKELEQAEESLQGNFSGIGIEFNVPQDTAVVINVIAGGPSEKVGIIGGDRIIKVEDRVVAGVNFNQDSLIRLLRGPTGSKVNVEVKRNGEVAPIHFTIKRDIIPVKSLDASFMVTPTLGYIKLAKFSRTSHSEFLESVKELKQKGMKSLLFDLRGNPGGYMDQAFLIANEFLEKDDLIVYMQGTHRPREEYKAHGNGVCKDIKLFVAIDENSASSSEILAGAIQDNDRGTLVGRRSYGKGLVQEPIYFSDSSGIRLTVARFYTPSGRCIQKPYSLDYNYDILSRYSHGEMQNVDSIPKNDSLAFKTIKKNRTVYGGGGIIPDVFIPIDTTGVSQFLIESNRKSLQLKFTSEFADIHRSSLSSIKTVNEFERFISTQNLKAQYLKYAESQGVKCSEKDWQESGDILILQLKGLIGRYSPLDMDAYYLYILQIDNLLKKVKELNQ